jgi:hypothetical protein
MCPSLLRTQITIATSLTLRVGSMAEQTFNAVERVEEYCHLPEEAAYELGSGSSSSSKKPSGPAGRSHSSSGGSGGSASAAAAGAAGRRSRAKTGADSSLREPLLPVTQVDADARAGSSSAGPLVVVDGAVPEGWPRQGSIEFSDVKMRWGGGSPSPFPRARVVGVVRVAVALRLVM